MLGRSSHNQTTRFIKRYGKKFTIVTDNDEFDPVTGESVSDKSFKDTIGIYTSLPDSLRDDGDVLKSDEGVYLMDKPNNGDVVKDDGVEYQVVRTVRIGTGSIDVCFLCQLRK